jgi:hypothetical protein
VRQHTGQRPESSGTTSLLPPATFRLSSADATDQLVSVLREYLIPTLAFATLTIRISLSRNPVAYFMLNTLRKRNTLWG